MIKLTTGQRVLISGLLAVTSFILKSTIGQQPITSIVMIATAVMAGTPILRNAISALRYKILGIDALVSIAVLGAMFIGEYWEAAAV
ncbi:MAG TPA: heavy metal translocating P-type ATPase, partial [Firmicutes bacterium]|nr:heavy metal translocating P-type ATPase [Bacillota bacterium]